MLVETSTSYGRSLVRGIIKYANIAGNWVFYNEPRGLLEKLPRLDKWEIDGIIMRDTPENLKLLKLHVPTVVSIRYQYKVLGVPNIIGNSDAIGGMAAEYLYNKGFRVFAFCGFDNFPWSREREEAFRNIACSKGRIYIYRQPSSSDYERELNEIAHWLSTLPKPVGVMACNDVRAAHVTGACKLAQIQVPDEVAIMGVNNDDLICELMSPPLSSISLNMNRAGQQAAMCLEEMMAGKKITERHIIVEPECVVTRKSTDILAIKNPNITTALRFIKANCKNFIQVDEVVEAVGVNRRSLERYFKQYLNHTIHEEIKRVRIEAILKMITETSLSIGEIAAHMGFHNINHISRYFKASKGVTPHEFRTIHNKG